MSKLYLVRHGQASFMSDDYDRLSPIGRKQAALLGDYWGKRGKRFHTSTVGPLRRHQQTFVAFAEGYEQHGLRMPRPNVLDEFAEHNGFSMMRAMLPELVKTDAFLAEHYKENMTGREYLNLFRHFMILWAKGEAQHPDHPTWKFFRETVQRGVDLVTAGVGRGQDAIVFTSGGTISAAVGNALHMPDEKAITLNWIVRNTGYAEFTFRQDMFSITEFNAIPHITDDELHTYV